jgi:hypothetical protein
MSSDQIEDLIMRVARLEERLRILENLVSGGGTYRSRIGEGVYDMPPSSPISRVAREEKKDNT